MIDLEEYNGVIESFIRDSTERFMADYKKQLTSIGIYCCPWAGWLTTNFNVNKTLAETNNNCPDFEFVEFDFLELNGWQEEYERESPAYKINQQVIHHRHDSGDEKLNELVFKFIEPLAAKLKKSYGSDILLQMLDSRCIKKF
jgi:hypothetical protein